MQLRTVCSTMFLVVVFCAAPGRAQIYQWAWVDPSDPSLGVYQSSTLCPGGAGVLAVPNANLSSLDLTQAYLINSNLTYAYVSSTTLTNADLQGANLTNADIDCRHPDQRQSC